MLPEALCAPELGICAQTHETPRAGLQGMLESYFSILKKQRINRKPR